MCFLEFEKEEWNLVRNAFSAIFDITIHSDVQDEFLDIKNNFTAKDACEVNSLNVFWCSLHQSYQTVMIEIALRPLMFFFFFDYLFVCLVSPLFYNSRLRTETEQRRNPDTRCEIIIVSDGTSISQLTESKQCQPSH